MRTSPPESDPGAEPSGFDVEGEHQIPKFGENCWIYARISNREAEPSYDAWVRFYVASKSANDFQFPADWDEMTGSDSIEDAGTFFIDEIGLDRIDGGDNRIVRLPWPSALIPPENKSDGEPWNPHILVEINPLDGPLEGTTVRDNNNLAQKSVTIDYS